MIDARTGQPLTTDSPEAAEQYRLAVDRILGSETGAAEALDHALTLDSNLALALAARYMLAKDAGSADAGLFKERALLAAEAALPWERAHVSALSALLEDPYSNLAATEAYIAANPRDLLVISQLCGYLIFYGGARKLERVLNIMESVDPSLHDDWACLARLGFAASEAGDQGRGRELVVAEQSSDRTRLSLRLVEAVSQFASGQYADAADTLKLVSPDERVGVGGSRVERMLIDLLEARAVELAET